MTTTQKFFGTIAAVVLVVAGLAFALGHSGSQAQPSRLGTTDQVGYLQQLVSWFSNTVYFGTTQQASIDTSGQLTTATTTNTTSYWTVGGIDYASVQVSMAATSSVPCAIPNPFGAATSTVLNHTAQITADGLTGTQTLDVSTSSSAYASSSPAFVKKFSATDGQHTLVWQPGVASTTNPGVIGYDSFNSTGASPYRLGPSEFLTTRVATGTAGTFASYFTGTCSATFMKP